MKRRPASTEASANRLLMGRPGVRRATSIHAINGFAESCFTVSLAGSLFFSISFDAARPRIIIYLLCTMAPFVVVAPLLGPLVDRVRGGHRAMITMTFLARCGVCIGLAGQLRDLVVFPLAFAMLVLHKTYSVTRNAMIPRLVPGDELVKVNSRLALAGTVVGGIGGSLAAAILVATSGRWVLVLAAAAYAVGAVVALRLPAATTRLVELDGELMWRELHERTVLAAQSSLLALRGSTGFLLFLLGVNLRRGGEPTWFFGLVFVANGAGNFAGNVVAPVLRKRISEPRMLTAAVAGGAVMSAIAALAANRVGTTLAAFTIGLCAAVAHQAFYAAVQQRSPEMDRGRTLAIFDTRFQLAWVFGALVAVTAQPRIALGFALLAAVLLADGVDQLLRRSRGQSDEEVDESIDDLSRNARRLVERGEYRAAALVMIAAFELGGPGEDGLVEHIRALRIRVLDGETIDRRDFERAAYAMGWMVEQ